MAHWYAALFSRAQSSQGVSLVEPPTTLVFLPPERQLRASLVYMCVWERNNSFIWFVRFFCVLPFPTWESIKSTWEPQSGPHSRFRHVWKWSPDGSHLFWPGLVVFRKFNKLLTRPRRAPQRAWPQWEVRRREERVWRELIPSVRWINHLEQSSIQKSRRLCGPAQDEGNGQIAGLWNWLLSLTEFKDWEGQ